MSKHRIKLRRGDFSSQRIEKHKNYGQLLEQHQRSGKLGVSNYVIGLAILASVVGLSYYALERIENIQLQQSEPNGSTEEILKEVVPIEKLEEVPPRPKDGLAAYNAYIAKELKYPQEYVEGIVYIAFTVEVDGSITELRVLKGLCEECDQAALDLIRTGPQWIPGTKAGETVKAPMVIPVTFILNNNIDIDKITPDSTGI